MNYLKGKSLFLYETEESSRHIVYKTVQLGTIGINPVGICVVLNTDPKAIIAGKAMAAAENIASRMELIGLVLAQLAHAIEWPVI